MRQKLLSLFLVLAIGMGLAVNLTTVSAEELTDYVIDLTQSGVDIQAGSTPGTVALRKGGSVTDDNLDPAASRFIFTTSGQKGSSFGIEYGLEADLNIVLRDCKIRQDGGGRYGSAYNDYGTGLVKLTLEGTNEMWSGDLRSGMRIPSGRICEVRGSGLLSVKGGAPIGAYGNNGYEDAGTLMLYEGTIISEGSDKSNAKVCYMGGSLKVLLRDNDTVKNSMDDTLCPVKVDFSMQGVQQLISEDNKVSVNGTALTLDKDKMAYLYLAEGTNKITYGKIGEDEIEMQISPVSSNSNPTIVILPLEYLGVSVVSGTNSAMLYGGWGSIYTGSRGFEYQASEVTPGTIPLTFTVTLEDGEMSKEISDLQQNTDYQCRAWGTNADGEKIYSEWVSFRTKATYDVTITGGTVTQGTPELDEKYLEGSKITVTADGDPAMFEGWYDESGILVSIEPVYTFVLTGDISLEARYYTYDRFLNIEDDSGVVSSAFESSGELPWKIEGLETGEPPYLRSGAITHNQSSSLTLKLNLSEAYRLNFQWKVTSEENYDELILVLNGEEQSSISGSRDWNETGVSVLAGTHTIEWRYTKDSSGSVAPDCGYLKGLRLTPVPMVTLSAQSDDPTHGSVSPESGQFPEGGNVKFTAVPASGYYLAYWKDESGNRIGDEPVLTVSAAEPQTYTAVFSILNQDYSALLAPESEKLNFETWGSIWTMQPDDSARSGALDNSDRSVLRTTVTVPEGEQRALIFDWRTSTRHDYLALNVNGEEWNTIYGIDSGWQKEGTILQAGTHTLEWIYKKNTSFMLAETEAELLAEGAPEECGWVKNIMVRTPELYTVNTICNPLHGKVGINWMSDPDVNGKFYEGTSLVINAQANEGYYFKEWQDEAGNTVSTNPYFELVVSGDITYTAIFGQLSLYDAIVAENSRPYFTFVKVDGEAWSVVDGVAESGNAKTRYSELSSVVTVPQGEGSKLLTFEWKVSSDSYDGDLLRFELDGKGKETIDGIYGGWARYAVVLEEGEHTIKWYYGGGSSYPDGENCGWVRNVELKAPGEGFVSLNVTPDMPGNAAVSPMGKLTEGTAVRLSAVADEGYACVGWKDQSGNLVSEWPEFTAYVYGSQIYTPVFEEESAFFESSSARAVITSGFSGDKTVIFAAYNDGCLTSCTVSEEYLYEGKIRIPAPSRFRPQPGETVKIFVWEDMVGMQPVI